MNCTLVALSHRLLIAHRGVWCWMLDTGCRMHVALTACQVYFVLLLHDLWDVFRLHHHKSYLCYAPHAFDATNRNNKTTTQKKCKIAFKHNFFVNIFGMLSSLFYDAFVLRSPHMQTTHSTCIFASLSFSRSLWLRFRFLPASRMVASSCCGDISGAKHNFGPFFFVMPGEYFVCFYDLWHSAQDA